MRTPCHVRAPVTLRAGPGRTARRSRSGDVLIAGYAVGVSTSCTSCGTTESGR